MLVACILVETQSSSGIPLKHQCYWFLQPQPSLFKEQNINIFEKIVAESYLNVSDCSPIFIGRRHDQQTQLSKESIFQNTSMII